MQKIIYSNKKNFSETLEKFKQQGLEKVHILADFDKTLTKLFVN
jgi:5S rRNA maturation endonuclease (ribonuclease M5)